MSATHRALALKCLVMAVGLIVYGSLYPFAFSSGASTPPEVLAWPARVGRGDMMANLLLYAPLGYCVYFAFPSWRGFLGGLALLVCSLSLSTALEIAQAYAPSRVSSLADVALNTAGVALGAGGAWAARRVLVWPGVTARPSTRAPLALLALWLAYRLAPFVPSLDMQQLKDALKPLVYQPIPEPVQVVYYTAIWLVVVRLLAEVTARSPVPVLAALVGTAETTARLVVEGKQLLPAELLGWALAVGLWHLGVRRAWMLAGLFGAAITLDGLRPFEFAVNGRLSLVPFRGFITGSFEAGLQAGLFKAYLAATLAWLLLRARCTWPTVLTSGTGLFLAIELAQTRLPGRVAELTDPLMFIAAAFVVRALDAGAHLRPLPRPVSASAFP